MYTHIYASAPVFVYASVYLYTRMSVFRSTCMVLQRWLKLHVHVVSPNIFHRLPYPIIVPFIKKTNICIYIYVYIYSA